MVPQPLIVKLLAINAAVILIVILFVWLAVDYLAADYFGVLMERYHISPTESHAMFLSSIHRYLIGASVLAALAAIGLSFLLTRRVLRPLSEINRVIRKLAAGDYSARVENCANDEIGRLGATFNQMSDSLQRIEELRHNMVVDVAHELRTPLTNIRGYLEALQDGVVSGTAKTFGLLHSEVFRLIHLVEDLQRLARADAAKGHLALQQVDLAELVEQVSALYLPGLRERQIRLETDIPEDAATLLADPDKLLQILSNLVQNACRYSSAQGCVRIAARHANGALEVGVENSGDAVADKDLPLLFERFYRQDRSRSRESGGAGIGLAIVRQLVEAHGGEVGVQNIAEGVRVWFRLPDAERAA
jgi:signal transduction histidine kinase